MAQTDLRTTNRAISALHTTATSIAALLLLRYSSWIISEPEVTETAQKKAPSRRLNDARNPIIGGRSSLANALTTWETLYLLYDTAFLIYESKRRNRLNSNAATVRIVAKESPAVLIHHLLLASAFMVLQSYIAAGKEKGLWVITALMLMNASNPLMHARWYMRRRTGKTSNVLDLTFLAVFAASRFGVVVWVLTKYGKYHGIGPWQAYRSLRKECQSGTAMLVGLNGAWWTILAFNITRRNLRNIHR